MNNILHVISGESKLSFEHNDQTEEVRLSNLSVHSSSFSDRLRTCINYLFGKKLDVEWTINKFQQQQLAQWLKDCNPEVIAELYIDENTEEPPPPEKSFDEWIEANKHLGK